MSVMCECEYGVGVVVWCVMWCGVVCGMSVMCECEYGVGVVVWYECGVVNVSTVWV
jgi:hypothetical protein